MPEREATGALPPDDTPRDLQAELEAEFADHLALAARDEMLRGRSADEAEEKANERFGDLTHIERQCRWVHQGDAVMLRTVMIGGLAILAIALGVTTWTSWQAQSRQAIRIDELTAKLEAIEETQPAPTTGTISGVAYLGDKSKPAVGVGIQLLKAPPTEIRGGSRLDTTRPTPPQWVVERRVTTDSQGHFTFEVLSPGTYAVYTSLRNEDDADKAIASQAVVQTVPKNLSPGEHIEVPLDIQFRRGGVRFSMSSPLPGPFESGDETLLLGIHGKISQPRTFPISSSFAGSPSKDTLRGYRLTRSLPVLQSLHTLPGLAVQAGHPNIYSDSRRGDFIEQHILKLRAEDTKLDDGLQACLLDPFDACNDNPRPWLEGTYTIALKYFLITAKGQPYGIDESLSYEMERFLRKQQVEIATSVREFTVAHGETTDLRVLIPSDLDVLTNDLIEAISEVRAQMKTEQPRFDPKMDQVFSFDYYRSRENQVEIDKSRLKLAALLNRAIEIEVTGPHPAE